MRYWKITVEGDHYAGNAGDYHYYDLDDLIREVKMLLDDQQGYIPGPDGLIKVKPNTKITIERIDG